MSTVNFTRSNRQASFRTFQNSIGHSELSPFDFQKEIGLDWSVSKEELSFNMIQTEGLESWKAVVRSDNGKAVGIVGKDYETVQNNEIFSFLTDLAQFDLEVKMVAGGSLGKGELVWALAKVPSLQIELGGTDIVETLLLVSNGHGGNATLKVDSMVLRKVCQNGMHSLTMASDRTVIGKGWNLKHTSGIQDRFAQAQGVVGKLARDHAITLGAMETLASIPATFETVEAIASKVWGKVPSEKGKARTIAENRLSDLRTIWTSPTSQGIETANTLWTAVNTITEWSEHESITRSGNYTQEESRIIGNYLGGSASRHKEEAYSYALQLAGIV